MTFYTALLYQLEITCIGLCALCIWCLFTGQDIKTVYPDQLKNWWFGCYFFVLSFLIVPYLIMKYNWYRYGLWGYFYTINPWFCWVSVAITVIFGGMLGWKYRKHNMAKE